MSSETQKMKRGISAAKSIITNTLHRMADKYICMGSGPGKININCLLAGDLIS